MATTVLSAPRPGSIVPSRMASRDSLTPEHKRQLRLVSRAQVLLDQALEEPDSVIPWPSIIGKAINPLTHKQRKFSMLRANGENVLEAYKHAYDVNLDRPDRDMIADASNIESNPKVLKAKDLLTQWVSQKWLLESADARDWALSKLYEEATFADKSSDRIKATELILRAHGGLTDRKEVVHYDAADLDNASALMRSAMVDLGLGDVLDAEFSVDSHVSDGPSFIPHGLATPNVSVALCSRCSSAIDAPVMGDGEGI